MVHELLCVAGLCLGLAMVRESRRLALRYWLGFAPLVCAWGTFNGFVYGAARGPHLMGPLDPWDPLKLAKLTSYHAMADRLSSQLAGGTGPLEWAIVSLAVFVPVVAWFSRSLAAAMAGLASVAALLLLVDPPPATGLFQVTPWLLFAFVGPGPRPSAGDWRWRAHRALAGCSLLFIALVAATPIVPGLNWGSRYMLTVLPVLALLALRSTHELFAARHRTANVALVSAFITLFGIVAALGNLRGMRFYKSKVRFDDAHASTLARISSATTATDLWWLGPESATARFATRLAMVVHVPASQQLDPLPPPPERDVAVRREFFDELRTARATEFAFVGTDGGRATLAARAQEFGFSQVEAHREEVSRSLASSRPSGDAPDRVPPWNPWYGHTGDRVEGRVVGYRRSREGGPGSRSDE